MEDQLKCKTQIERKRKFKNVLQLKVRKNKYCFRKLPIDAKRGI
jgi:hypothetical protein